MAQESGIVVGGVTYPLLHPLTQAHLPVVTWRGVGPRAPEFRAGDGYNKKRVKRIDCCVWHWTGGENEPDVVAEVLRTRKLGVEFAIGRTGAVWQFCDPAVVDTADAGPLNSRSVGVEVTCYGFAGSWKFDPVRALRVPVVPKLGKDRELYAALTHGRSVQTAKLYPAQMVACLALADALSAALDIPRRVPPVEATTVLPGVGAFQGHLGHFHVSAEKRDPGPWFVDQLRQHFEAG